MCNTMVAFAVAILTVTYNIVLLYIPEYSLFARLAICG